MEYSALIRELGNVLGIDLTMTEAGTCGVFFDEIGCFGSATTT